MFFSCFSGPIEVYLKVSSRHLPGCGIACGGSSRAGWPLNIAFTEGRDRTRIENPPGYDSQQSKMLDIVVHKYIYAFSGRQL